MLFKIIFQFLNICNNTILKIIFLFIIFIFHQLFIQSLNILNKNKQCNKQHAWCGASKKKCVNRQYSKLMIKDNKIDKRYFKLKNKVKRDFK